MIEISKISILSKIFNSLPIIILFISVLNEFDFNCIMTEIDHQAFWQAKYLFLHQTTAN